jgi:hypothetical protein
MKLRISLNEEKGIEPSHAATGWRVADVEIKTIEDAREVFCNYSYSPHEWVGGYRSQANYKNTNFLVIDYDDGVTIDQAKETFKSTIDQAKETFKSHQYIIITSRNHQKVKSGHEADGKIDRFHVILPIQTVITEKASLVNLKLATLFAGSDPSVFDTGRMIYASPEDAKIFLNEDGNLLDVSKLTGNGKINFAKVKTPKQRFFNYPETVRDAYNNETPLLLYEGSAIKSSDLKNNTVVKSTPKFWCPLGDDCPKDEHHSPSSYLVELEDGTFIIKDFAHPETIIFKRAPVAERCHDWFRVGANFNEVVLLKDEADVRLTRRGKEDVLTRLGEDAPAYIIKEKSVPDPVSFDFIGGEGKDLSYQYMNDRLVAYAPLPRANINDNGYIDEFLTELFGEYVYFIKSWIAYFTYSNFRHLPILILTGPRGTGKSLFTEIVGMIYNNLYGRFDTATNYSEHNGLKLAIIEEADEIDNKKLYSILKDVGGTEKLIRNVKYGPKTIVRNNLNIIVLSNNRIPLYLKSKEYPTSEFNNQFFVFNLKPVTGQLNNSLKSEISKRIGWWLRTEIKDLFDRLESRSESDRSQCRYQIPVPITPDELLLFENNKTEVEIILEEFLEGLKTDYIVVSDLRALETKNINLHQLKRKLIDQNVIKSTKSHSDKRKLINVKGFIIDKGRYLKLTLAYLNRYVYRMPQK